MMKKRTIASKVEKNWTVLLVDGQGRIRRIPNFRRKMWIVAGFSLGALAVALAMGLLYGSTLEKRRALEGDVASLENKLIAMRQQNELLKARAVRLETLVAKPETAATEDPLPQSPASRETTPPPTSAAPTVKTPPPERTEPAPETAPARVEPPETDAPEPEIAPQVDAEALKIAFRPDTETIEARFVIKNTGETRAEGRAVVVLETEEGSTQMHLVLPAMPLKDGRPRGNRGRRFSISRFMNVELERKFAEPGTRFVQAMVYAYSLEGQLLLEKTFDVALDIPEMEPPPEEVPTAAPLGLTLPEPDPEETTGVQP